MPKTDVSAPVLQPKAAAAPLTAMSVIAPLVAWLIPGGGHLIQKKWVRGVLLMFSVVLMFVLGVAMGGKIYKANTGDLLDMLGFVGDAGMGGLYIVSRMMDLGSASLAYATADYGKILIVMAGILNVMCMVDAYHIAMGRKK